MRIKKVLIGGPERKLDLPARIDELEEELAYLKAGVERDVSPKTTDSSDD